MRHATPESRAGAATAATSGTRWIIAGRLDEGKKEGRKEMDGGGRRNKVRVSMHRCTRGNKKHS